MNTLMAALKDLIMEQKTKVGWLVLLIFAAQSLSLITVVLVGKVVDALVELNYTLAYQLIIGFVVMAIFSSIISILQLALRDHMFHNTVASLALRWCRQLLTRDHAFFKSCDIGSLIRSYSRGLDTRYYMYVLMGEHALYHSLKSGLMAGYIVYLGGEWMLMVLGVTCVMFVLAVQGLVRLRRTQIVHLNQARDRAGGHQAALISALPSLQSVGATRLAVQRMSGCYEVIRRREVMSSLFSSFIQGLNFLLPALTSVTILYLALHQGLAWQAGDFVVVFLLISELMSSLNKLIDVVPAMDEQIEHQRTILSAIVATEEECHDRFEPHPQPGELIIAPFNHPLDHQGEVKLICEDRIVLPAGMHLAIMGATGQGKTALAEVICGIRQSPGVVVCAGYDVALLSENDRRQLFYFANNPPDFLHGDFLQFTLVGSSYAPEMMEYLVDKLSLRGLKEQWDSHKSAQSLSSGEKKRLSLLRACLLYRPITLLDEPTESLPAADVAEIWPLLTEHFSGRTLICLTHDPKASVHFQRVLEIKNHRLGPTNIPYQSFEPYND